MSAGLIGKFEGYKAVSPPLTPTWMKLSAVSWFVTPPAPLANPALVRDLLDNDQFWIDKYGQAHLIEQMSIRYKLNVLGYLQRHAAEIFEVARTGVTIDLFEGWNPQAWLITRLLVLEMRDQVVHNVGGSDD